tara:strand:- start:1186 stop:1479 length:294 start_codon:yes stop_codon:yes gene_type:complete
MNYKTIKITQAEVVNQKTSVMWHLLDKQTITSWEAIKEYGATRLSAIIFNLREENYNIVTIPNKRTNRFGRTINIAKYKYIPPISNTSSHKEELRNG